MSTFSTATNFPVGANPNSVVVGDFNKDGKPDIATSYSQLSITQENTSTFIRLSASGEILASLNGVSASLINAADFSLV